MPKFYRVRIRLGARSDTDDIHGHIIPSEQRAPSRADVENALAGFVGAIEQIPPAYSAVHVGGRRAYEMARAGRHVSLAPRPVVVNAIEVMAFAYPHLDLEVRCGKGTYIRSLARDLGEALGSGGLVEALRRLRIGPFNEAAAINLETTATAARAQLLPLVTAVAELPAVQVSFGQARRLGQGQAITLTDLPMLSALATGEEVAVLAEDGVLAAVARMDAEKGMLLPAKCFLV
jgi:tRNA pseudouridine55 synthase